jgi:hypothetical protein
MVLESRQAVLDDHQYLKKSSVKSPISGLRELRAQMYSVNHVLLGAAVEVRC